MALLRIFAAFFLMSLFSLSVYAGEVVAAQDLWVGGVAQPLRIIALLTVLAIAPAILVVLTSFTRIVIVLSMLRHAMGLQSTPPNIVIIILSLLLTFFTMFPVLKKIEEVSLSPLLRGEITEMQAVSVGFEPLRSFMLRQTKKEDIASVLSIAPNIDMVDVSGVLPFHILATAFLLSELKIAFQIGFVIFIPFLLIDLVVASVLMSMGMIMVPPLTISLPIKVLMFVLIDGWAILAKALVASFSY